MSIVLRCHDCDRDIELTQRPSSGKVVCPTCHTMLAVGEPGEGEGEAADAAGGVYTTVQVKNCPLCNKETTPAAVLCINCGFNFQTGKQTRKIVRVKTMEREWWWGLIPIYFSIVRLRKTKEGETRLTVTHNLCFIPASTIEIDLRDCQEIWTDYRQGFGALGWAITLVLILLCVLPGLLWWIWAFSKPTYILRLPRINQAPVTLYEGMIETKMQDILDNLVEMGELKIVRK
jgi:hypothetical protein